MRYNYLYQRVEYPLERGHRMEVSPLPDWIQLEIVESEDQKQLVVHSRLHRNQEVKINPVYSKDFSDLEIIKGLSGKISSMFL